MKRHPLGVVLVALALFLFFAGPTLVSFYTDWLWYLDVGFQRVYLITLRAQGTLFTIVFSIAAVWLVANLRVALASIGEARPIIVTRQGMEVALPGRRQLQTLASAAGSKAPERGSTSTAASATSPAGRRSTRMSSSQPPRCRGSSRSSVEGRPRRRSCRFASTERCAAAPRATRSRRCARGSA